VNLLLDSNGLRFVIDRPETRFAAARVSDGWCVFSDSFQTSSRKLDSIVGRTLISSTPSSTIPLWH